MLTAGRRILASFHDAERAPSYSLLAANHQDDFSKGSDSFCCSRTSSCSCEVDESSVVVAFEGEEEIRNPTLEYKLSVTAVCMLVILLLIHFRIGGKDCGKVGGGGGSESTVDCEGGSGSTVGGKVSACIRGMVSRGVRLTRLYTKA